MPPRPATPGRPYPNIGQAILLVVVAAALQAATGATAYAIVAVARDDGQTTMSVVFNPWILLPVVGVAGGLALALGLRATHEPARRFFRVHPFSPRLIPAVIIGSLGLAVILHEIDNGILELVGRLAGPDKVVPDLIDVAVAPVGAALLLMLAGPLIEEYLFRGMILRGLLENTGRFTAIVVSAVLFGFIHGNLRQFVIGVTLGATFGWWYERTRSVGPGLLGHAVFNSVTWVAGQLPAWGLALGLRRDKYPLVHEPWGFLLGGVVLAAVGFWDFARHASAVAPDRSWLPVAPPEPPLLEPPPLLIAPGDQAGPDTRAAAPVS